MLGEVFAETIRVFGERIWFAFGLGLAVAGAIGLRRGDPQRPRSRSRSSPGLRRALRPRGSLRRGRLGRRGASARRRAGARASVLGLVVTLPLSLGIIDPLVGLVAAFWLGIMGFAIPVAVMEEATGGFAQRVAGALRRSVAIGRAAYLHAVGVIAAFVHRLRDPRALAHQRLGGFAENGLVAAVLITEGFLLPFLFLGLAVLFFEQRSRAISSS